jgi:asparagine synthase (glutamine-hydrolysing)
MRFVIAARMTMDSISATASDWRCAASRYRSQERAPTYPNADRTAWIVFNGEIYNYRELRKQLERWVTLLHRQRHRSNHHAYDEYGTDCPKHLRACSHSQFGTNVTNHFSRARSGRQETAAVCQTSDQLIFGSEFTALLAHPRSAAR